MNKKPTHKLLHKATASIGDNDTPVFSFPKTEMLKIEKDALQIQLEKFKKAVLKSFSIDSVSFSMITLVALWVPVITSDFKGVLSVSSEMVSGIYITFAIIVSIFVICKNFFFPIGFYLKRKVSKVSPDSEKMAGYILEKCNKNKNK
jgi:hypothetical protein